MPCNLLKDESFWGSWLLWNTDNLLTESPYPRRWYSTYTLPWEPQIFQIFQIYLYCIQHFFQPNLSQIILLDIFFWAYNIGSHYQKLQQNLHSSTTTHGSHDIATQWYYILRAAAHTGKSRTFPWSFQCWIIPTKILLRQWCQIYVTFTKPNNNPILVIVFIKNNFTSVIDYPLDDNSRKENL